MLNPDSGILIATLLLIGLLLYLRTYHNNRIFPTVDSLNQRRVRIILPTGGSGLLQDAKIYQSQIPNSYIIQVDRNSPDLHPDSTTFVDINLYLEVVIGSKYFPGREKWLMVNQEQFSRQYADKVDYILTKSRYAQQLISDYVVAFGLPAQVVYLGHTSWVDTSSQLRKDWSLCLHLAGQSPYKGTRQLINQWQDNDGFRHLDSRSRLVITCRETCLHRIEDIISSLLWRQDHWEDPKTGLYIFPRMSDHDLAMFQQTAGLYICPSLVEGYGHYINEGCANGAVVMTTNFPPMNELVPSNPFLIPPSITLNSFDVMGPVGFLEPYLIGNRLDTAKACIPDWKCLTREVRTYFLSSSRQKEKWGQANREHFDQRTNDFKSRLHLFTASRIQT